MKLLFGIVIFYLLAEFSYAIFSDEEFSKILMKSVSPCKESTSVSEDDVIKFTNYEIADNHKAKCYAACILKAIEIMTPDNKLDKEKFGDRSAIVFANHPDKVKKNPQAVNDCGDVTHPDECEAAFKLGKCLEVIKI